MEGISDVCDVSTFIEPTAVANEKDFFKLIPNPGTNFILITQKGPKSSSNNMFQSKYCMIFWGG
jgi:hypothetical protein